MKPAFETKRWKAAAILGYIGMHTGLLVVTAVLPLTFLRMGETNLEDIALHCLSMKRIQYWLLGIGLITFLSDTLAVLGAMMKRRGFRIFVMALIFVNIALIVTLLAWGNVESDQRKDYFQETWNGMHLKTKNIIQSYYSCCGFESYEEWTSAIIPVDSSCKAIESSDTYWPEGCYARVTSISLPAPVVTNSAGEDVTVGSSKNNAFFVAYILSLSVLIIVQLLNAGIYLFAFSHDLGKKAKKPQVEPLAYENGHAINANVIERNGVAVAGVQNGDTHTNSVSKIADGYANELDIETIVDDQVESRKKTTTDEGKKPWYKAYPDYFVTAYVDSFYWLGVRVGRYPKMTILLSLLLTGTMTVGILQRYEPPSGSGSFLPDDNEVLQDYVLYISTFVVRERDQYMIVEDESDVLSPSNFLTALNLDTSVKALSTDTGASFSSICLRLVRDCKERSLFEFWNYDKTLLASVSTSELLQKINEDPLVSPVFGDEVNIAQIIGDVTNTTGTITAAKAHLLHYVTIINNDTWEEQFIDLGNRNYEGVSVYVSASSSRTLEGSAGYQKELPLLFAGFGLIFIYIFLMTGKFSLLEHRTYVALMGISAAGLSMGSGIGLAASFGLEWSVLHLIVPFLVIGIGVDDMFVLLQAWNNVDNDPELKHKSISEKSGHVLKTAGVSITVTSVTDLVAFGVGASSDLGAFASFSVYVAICIILLFFLECTFFMACTVLDHRRRDRRYDACLACCYKHKESYKPGNCANREIFQRVFEDGLGRIVINLPFAIIAILTTLGLSGFMAWGFYKLEVKYDPDWYLPVDSYLIDFNQKFDLYFSGGAEAAMYVINTDFYAEREKLHQLYQLMNNNADVDHEYLSSWFEEFATWVATNQSISNIYAEDAFASSTVYYSAVQTFLLTSGRKYAYDVVFKDGVQVGSKFPFRHRAVNGEVENIDIVDKLRADCDSLAFTGAAFPFGRRYFNFEITKIIRTEVYRNLGITLGCVFLMVLPMMTSIQMSLWVVLCVIFTIVDVAGSMYFAGLSIEASTIITLLLSVGLAVDYAAHIGHKFLILSGPRKLRARVTLAHMGQAVFNGGFSTFLALVLLSGSDTYSYKVFFTVFGCVIGYGLWNGLVFLPCVLGLIGPPPNVSATEAKLSERHYQRKKESKEGKSDHPVELEITKNDIKAVEF